MMSVTSPSNPVRRRWWIVWCLVATGLALVGWQLSLRGGMLRTAVPDPAAEWLAKLEQALDLPVRERSPLELAGPDGPMPRIASRALRIADNAEAVRSGVVRACDRIGLVTARADRRAADPDALCEGREHATPVSVHLKLRCERECVAYLQTQVIGS